MWWIYSAVFWAVAMATTPQHSSDRFVDLSNQNLSSVPRDLPHRVERLDLSRNRIGRLHEGDFQNTPQLRFLNVSWNNLVTIDPNVFVKTLLLRNLDLSHNELTHLDDQQFLRRAGNLRVLHLHQNNFTNMTLGKEFSALTNLKTLSLEAEQIYRGDFMQISQVQLVMLVLYVGKKFEYEKASLQDVRAEMVEISFLKNQPIHHDLVLDALQLFGKVELTNLTSGYQVLTDILSSQKTIQTTNLCLSNLEIKWTDATDFVKAALQTTILNLTITDIAFRKLPKNDTAMPMTSNMTSFTIKRAVVKDFYFSQAAVYNFFINLPVQKLDIFETAIIHMTCPKSPSSVQHLNFSFCALSDTIFYRVENQDIIECKNLSKAKTLSIMDNNLRNLQTISKRLQYMVSLEELDLSLNSLVYDGLESCLWPQKITVMNLSFNSLSHSVFNCLPRSIETLDLQTNDVSVVPSSVMNFQRLLSLNLNVNRLRDLPVCSGFPLLNVLLLKSNSLHAPSVDKLQTCRFLKTLDVSHNPFTCVCRLRKFRNLAIRSERSPSEVKLLNWPMGYICLYPEELKNTTLKAASMPEIYCSNSLLAAAILCPTIFTIIAIVTACQYFDMPWYIGMIWQWTRAKHRALRQNLPAQELAGIEFHAFVSFSQQNAEWVHDSLLPNLSELRICHHEKHFLPGRTIIQNIMRSVQKSRRSVFVLSAHFVKSEWCHYELYFATHQRLARGPDSVVLVLLEPLPQYLIPSKYHQLKSMMRRHTYLEWPQEKAKQRLFWANLRAALQSDIPGTPEQEE